MKQIFFIALTLLTINAIGQSNKIVKNSPNYDRKYVHFGFTVGANTMNFAVYPSLQLNSSEEIYAINSIGGPGFHLGPISNFRLGTYFDARVLIDLSFGQRTLDYTIKEIIDGQNQFTNRIISIESIFLEAPVLLKYKAVREGNYRPYVITGINPKFDFASRKTLKPDELTNKIRLSPMDLCYEVGFGIDYYLPYFKFSTEFKYSFGILNMLPNDGTEFTNSIDKLNSRMFMVSLHFE